VVDQVAIVIPRPIYREGSAFTATAYFRTRSTAEESTPTNVKYRLDCLTTGKVVADWTDVTPAASVSISVTGTHNAIQDQGNLQEVKQLTVAADHGLDTRVHETAIWRVENLQGIT